MQIDNLVTQIDHAVSIYSAAEYPWTIEEAVRNSNAYENLGLAHSRCNTIKSGRDFDEFLEDVQVGKISLDPPKAMTLEDLEILKQEQHKKRSAIAKKWHASRSPEEKSATAKKGNETKGLEGRLAAARKAKETMTPEKRSAAMKKANETLGSEGRSARARRRSANMTPEQRSAAMKKSNETRGAEGRAAAVKKRIETMGPEGLSAVAKKRIETMGPEGLSAAAKKRWKNLSSESRLAISIATRLTGINNKENGLGIFAPGMQAKGGRIAGAKTKENGTGIFAPGAAAKGRRRMVESGQLALANWIHWHPQHIARNIVKPGCPFCEQSVLVSAS